MRNSIFTFVFIATGSLLFAQVISISTNLTPSVNTGGIGDFTNTGNNTNTQNGNGTSNGRNNNSTYTFSSSGSNTTTTTNTNTTYSNNGYNNSYGTYGYNNGYNNNGYTNSNNYNNNYNNNNYNNTNQSSYTTNNDGYGSSVEVEDENGKRTIIETTTDSTQAEANKSIQDKINKHIVHFTGLVMSDNYNEGNLSKAYVMDKYSEFLKPGKYGNISVSLPNSVAYTFDGIAIPPKTRLVIYSGLNFTGTKLVDVTGPAIINNNKWEFDDRYSSANKKTYCSELQPTFPQTVRQWSVSDMHEWQNGSIEITEVP